jgi:hypothetical protein
VQQQPQPPKQVRWGGEVNAAAAGCQRIHSTPVPCAPGVFGQRSAPLQAPLLAPPPAFQLASFAATAAAVGCISEPLPQLPPQRVQLAPVDSSRAGSSSAEKDSVRGAVQGAEAAPPAEPCSSEPAQVLVVSPALPAGMQRTQWSLSDFWISKRLYRGYASSVYHVSVPGWIQQCKV